METIETIIMHHIFFKDFKEEYLRLIAGCAKNVVFKTGEVILEEGKPSEYFYLIQDGMVAIEITRASRSPIMVQTITGGDTLGWSWLIPPYKNRFNCRAIEPTIMIAFDGKCLKDKCEENHDLGYDLLKRIARIFAQRLEATRMQLINLYEIK